MQNLVTVLFLIFLLLPMAVMADNEAAAEAAPLPAIQEASVQ